MCGLAGLFILPDSQPPLPDFNLALAAMKHRGPDDEGFLHFNWVLFLLNQKKIFIFTIQKLRDFSKWTEKE
jgi:asparagine synthetase B (glutamine-hydrolysing)